MESDRKEDCFFKKQSSFENQLVERLPKRLYYWLKQFEKFRIDAYFISVAGVAGNGNFLVAGARKNAKAFQ
jgi:hypothetical protein